jgi:hypothetical protein
MNCFELVTKDLLITGSYYFITKAIKYNFERY